jgi:hypothetical protein
MIISVFVCLMICRALFQADGLHCNKANSELTCLPAQRSSVGVYSALASPFHQHILSACDADLTPTNDTMFDVSAFEADHGPLTAVGMNCSETKLCTGGT